MSEEEYQGQNTIFCPEIMKILQKIYYLTKKHASTVGKLDPYEVEMVANDGSYDESSQAVRS